MMPHPITSCHIGRGNAGLGLGDSVTPAGEYYLVPGKVVGLTMVDHIGAGEKDLVKPI